MSDRFRINHTVVLESLEEGATRIGLRIHEDVFEHFAIRTGKFTTAFSQVRGAAELLAWLEQLTRSAQGGQWPILHLDMHGDESGLALVDSTRLSWRELGEWTSELNVATEHNLVVAITACSGAHFIKALDSEHRVTQRRAPFFAFVGPRRKITEGLLHPQIAAFYRRLFETNDMGIALGALDAKQPTGEPEFFAISSTFYFQRLWSYYKASEMTGKAKRRTVERLTTRLKNETGASISELRGHRKQIRKSIEAFTRATFEEHRTFFFGLDLHPHRAADFSITYDEIEAHDLPGPYAEWT